MTPTWTLDGDRTAAAGRTRQGEGSRPAKAPATRPDSPDHEPRTARTLSRRPKAETSPQTARTTEHRAPAGREAGPVAQLNVEPRGRRPDGGRSPPQEAPGPAAMRRASRRALPPAEPTSGDRDGAAQWRAGARLGWGWQGQGAGGRACSRSSELGVRCEVHVYRWVDRIAAGLGPSPDQTVTECERGWAPGDGRATGEAGNELGCEGLSRGGSVDGRVTPPGSAGTGGLPSERPGNPHFPVTFRRRHPSLAPM